MTKKIRIAIIFGGRSGEHDVSLMSTRSILKVLQQNPNRFDIFLIGITREGCWVTGENVFSDFENGLLKDLTPILFDPTPNRVPFYTVKDDGTKRIIHPLPRPDVILPVLHGTFGEDGTLQGLLEFSAQAYVGAGVLASSVCMDKPLFKDVMRAQKLPVIESITVNRNQIDNDIQNVIKQSMELAPFPLFTKPANLGSSVGITKCHDWEELGSGLHEAARYDRRILVERGIDAREFEVSVLGNDKPEASVPGEIIPSDEFYSYNAKYLDGKSQALIPAPVSPEICSQLQNLAVQAFKATDCCGMARVDFLMERSTEKIYISEVNTIPGFTQISMFPKLWEVSGLDYSTLILRLAELALERKSDRDRNVQVFRR